MMLCGLYVCILHVIVETCFQFLLCIAPKTTVDRREGIIIYNRTSHVSTIKTLISIRPIYSFLNWLYTKISFKTPKSIYSKSFEMN